MAEVVVTEFQLNIDGFEANLKKATSSMGAFDKEVDDTQANTLDLEGTLGSAGQKLKVLSKEAGGAGKGVKDFGKTVQGGGGVVRTFTGELNSAFPVFGRIATAARAMGVAITTALGPVGLVIAAIVAAFALLGKIFTGTQQGADLLDRAIQPLKAIFETLLGIVQELTIKLVETFSNPKQALKDLGALIEENLRNRIVGVGDAFDAFLDLVINGAKGAALAIKGIFSEEARKESEAYFETAREAAGRLGESTVQALTGVDDLVGKLANGFGELGDRIGEAAQRGLRLADIKIELQELRIEQAKTESALNRQFQEQISLAQDVNKTAAEREEAAERAVALRKQITEQQVLILKLELEELELAALNNDTGREELLIIEQKRAAIDDLLASEERETRRVRNVVNTLRKQETDRAIAERKRLDDARRKADEEEVKARIKAEEEQLAAAIARVEAQDRQDLELSQRRAALLKGELETLKAAQEEELALRIAGGEDGLQVVADQALQRKALEDQIREAEIGALLAKFDAEYAAAEKAGTDLDALTRVQEAELEAFKDEKREEDLEKRKEYYETVKQLALESEEIERNVQQAKSDAAKAAGDVLIDQLSKTKEGAALAIAAQKAQAVAQVVIATQAAIAAAQAAAASVPAILPPGIPNPAFPVAQALAAANIARLKVGAAFNIATILAQAISGAYEGERNIGAGGERPVFAGPKDRYLRRVHKGEDIISAKRTAKYRDILDMVHDDTLGKWMANMQPQTDGRYLPMMSMMAEGGAEKWMTTVTRVNNYGTPSSASKGAAFNDRRIVGALVGVGSSKEQRRQTQLLESMNAGMSRRQNKRYRA